MTAVSWKVLQIRAVLYHILDAQCPQEREWAVSFEQLFSHVEPTSGNTVLYVCTRVILIFGIKI
jgi:hypothetical protein